MMTKCNGMSAEWMGGWHSSSALLHLGSQDSVEQHCNGIIIYIHRL